LKNHRGKDSKRGRVIERADPPKPATTKGQRLGAAEREEQVRNLSRENVEKSEK